MKRLIIVCEGETEQEFCNVVLRPHFMALGATLAAPLIKHSHGGIVSWARMKAQIEGHLRERDAVVSMLVDYYRIRSSYEFPGWNATSRLGDSRVKAAGLFPAMRGDIVEELRCRFVPYVQFHEFEGLLFSDTAVYRHNFDATECDFRAIDEAAASVMTPEEINNRPDTAPSVRLAKAIRGYNKIVYGPMLAEQIGLATIRRRCPLFDAWIGALEDSIKE